MFLHRLYLHHFRLYHEASFEFCPGINTICGPNAQGKTTLLEAIYVLMTGRSFRALQTDDLIRLGAPYFYIEAHFSKHGIEQNLKMSCHGKERKIFYNGNVLPALSSLIGLLQGVLMTPQDLTLIKGGPQSRRHFLDLQIAQVDPLYVHYLTRYDRAMRQRNCLLRAKDSTTLDSWEYEMANAAAYLTQQRSVAVEDLQDSSRRLHQVLSGEHEDLRLTFKAGAALGVDQDNMRRDYLVQYQKMRRREMELGFTLVGPHKEDFTLSIGEKDARFFASEGQQRSCVAALRFAEWERLNRLATEPPLLLIDDVGISLDKVRRERLMSQLQDVGQVFLTATEEQPLEHVHRDKKVIYLSKG